MASGAIPIVVKFGLQSSARRLCVRTPTIPPSGGCTIQFAVVRWGRYIWGPVLSPRLRALGSAPIGNLSDRAKLGLPNNSLAGPISPTQFVQMSVPPPSATACTTSLPAPTLRAPMAKPNASSKLPYVNGPMRPFTLTPPTAPTISNPGSIATTGIVLTLPCNINHPSSKLNLTMNNLLSLHI